MVQIFIAKPGQSSILCEGLYLLVDMGGSASNFMSNMNYII